MSEDQLEELDGMIWRALTSFVDQVHARRWRGREHECVSLFAHLLSAAAAKGSVLFDPMQIVVGALVPGVRGMNSKHDRNGIHRVNKDLVLWPTPWGTALGEDWMVRKEPPLAVMEWKVLHPRDTVGTRRKKQHAHTNHDVPWITRFSEQYAPALGFAVLFEIVEQRGGAVRIDRLNLVAARQGQLTAPLQHERHS